MGATHGEPLRESHRGPTPARPPQRATESIFPLGEASPRAALALQHAVGNTTVARLVRSWASAQAGAGGSTSHVVQRMAAWKKTNHPNTYLDTFADTLNAVVQKAATVALDPDSLPGLDGHITLWQDTAVLIKAKVQNEIEKDDDEAMAEADAAVKFAPARYGYAVESLACGESATLKGALPANCTYQLQAGRGMTRPDIVVQHSTDGEIGWFDITSDGSLGHIDLKTGSGWQTRPYVAEFTYPALNVDTVGTSKLTIGQRVALKNTIKRRVKAWEQLVANKRKSFMSDWDIGDGDTLTKKTDKQELAREAAGRLLGFGDKATPQITKSLLRVFLLSVKDFGFDKGGTKAEGESLLRTAFMA